MEQPHRPVAMAIVDGAGVLLAYRQLDGLRMFTRRHAIRKAYTAAITGMNSGQFGEDCLKSRGTTVREIGGDLELMDL
jgi:glc operon protein GlcG